MAMGMTCHDGPHLERLRDDHAAALSFMWRTFDLVGVTEMFDEFVLELTDLAGLQRPAYRKQVVSPVTLAEQDAQRKWTVRPNSTTRTPTSLYGRTRSCGPSPARSLI